MPEKAAEIAQIDVQKIYTAAEWMAKPTRGRQPAENLDHDRERAFYWSNNTGNTNAISALGIICRLPAARPGQVIGRAGGHQRGGLRGGVLSPQQVPGKIAGPPSPGDGYRPLY